MRRGISCFSHRWRYGLDGSLKSVTQPEQFPDLRKEDLGLIPAAVDSWNGLLFVHVDEHPTDSLNDWLGEFRDRLGPFSTPRVAGDQGRAPLGLTSRIQIVVWAYEHGWTPSATQHAPPQRT